MLTNENNWTLPEPISKPIPEPTPKPTPKKRGVLFLSPEDMQEAKKSMKEKGIKAQDVKNLPLSKKYMVLIYHLLKKHMALIYHLLKKHMVLITRHR